ncbi:MAG TPA: hypothetical protein VMB83_14225 [Roseiarcus sp.]|nr:hypothetical protein [Roseiarcus sp.]
MRRRSACAGREQKGWSVILHESQSIGSRRFGQAVSVVAGLKLQIVRAPQVNCGKRPQVRFGHTESLKKASRESEDQQARLL